MPVLGGDVRRKTGRTKTTVGHVQFSTGIPFIGPMSRDPHALAWRSETISQHQLTDEYPPDESLRDS